MTPTKAFTIYDILSVKGIKGSEIREKVSKDSLYRHVKEIHGQRKAR